MRRHRPGVSLAVVVQELCSCGNVLLGNKPESRFAVHDKELGNQVGVVSAVVDQTADAPALCGIHAVL